MSPHTAIPAPYASVSDLLRATITSPPIARGTQHLIYNFPPSAPGLEDFVLRIHKRASLDELLQHSTSLTPVERIVSGMHIGQPLMVLNQDPDLELQILPRQQGVSLFHHRHTLEKQGEKYEKAHPRPRTSYMDVTDDPEEGKRRGYRHYITDLSGIAETSGTNPFLPIFEQVYHLANSFPNMLPDLTVKNVFIDKAGKALHLVDMFDARDRTLDRSATERFEDAIGHLRYQLFKNPPNVSKDYLLRREGMLQEMRQEEGHVDRLLMSARSQVLANHAHDAAGDAKVAFAKVSDIEAAALEAPPEQLVQQLQAIQRAADITR